MPYKSKAKQAARAKAYRLAHLDELRAYQKAKGPAYRKSHQEQIRAYAKVYAESHHEKIAARQKVYQKLHKKEMQEYHRTYYQKHRDKTLARRKITYPIWREAHKHERRAYHLKLNHGLTIAAFNDLLSAQGGVCAICRGTKWGRQGPNIDHDHKTGKMRGILCHWCNMALGYIHDEKQVALSMAAYLQKHDRKI